MIGRVGAAQVQVNNAMERERERERVIITFQAN